jgi:predicted component of type VI protein secretion system
VERLMPYIILTANGEEFQRKSLSGPVVIGRSAECGLSVRDVLMSRKHCRIEPGTGKEKGRWRFIDLGSSNGSHVNFKKIERCTLVDGDAVRMGRTWITFRSGPFVPAPAEVGRRESKLVRPADPHEALSGTVTDFVYVDRDDRAEPTPEFDGTPSPRGRHVASGRTIYSPLEELSSSWDSIVSTISRPKRPTARPIPRAKGMAPVRREVDVSLHAHPMQVPYLEVIPSIQRRKVNLLPALILTLGIAVATMLVLVSGWVMTRG